MRGKRAKWIRKKLLNGHPAIYLDIRNHVGERTRGMSTTAIYRTAKRLWTSGKANKKFWLRDAPKQEVPNELKRA